GEGFADDWGGFEAVGAPAGGDVEAFELGFAEDWAVVGAEVAEPGPASEDAGVFELGEQLERVAGDLLQEVERALHAVGGPGLYFCAHQELAPVGLGDVDVHLRGHDHDVEQRLDGLCDAGLQDVGGDRQPHAGHLGDQAAPAGGAIEYGVRADPAPVRDHP